MRAIFGKRGIALKTFMFALMLMTSVMLVTLGILYAFMPSYYFRHMTRQLDRSVDALIEQIGHDLDVERTRQAIQSFANANNASVMPLNDAGFPLLHLSSFPFIAPLIPPLLLLEEEAEMLLTESDVHQALEMLGDTEGFFPFERLAPPESLQIMTFVPIEYTGLRTTIVPGTLFADDLRNIISFTRQVNRPDISHLIITITLQPIDQAQVVILAMLPYLALAGFAVAVTLALVFSRRLTHPILKISNAAVRMRELQPGVFSGVASNDELGDLSRNLDKLYQDLCANIKDLQVEIEKTAKLEKSKADFMRAAGHELKTPIAALGGMVDGMLDQVGAYKDRDKYLPELRTQTDKLTRLVHEILSASQSDSLGDGLELGSVNLDELVDEVVQQYKPFALQKNLSIRAERSGGHVLETDRRLLHIALSNLLSNAVKHTSDGGCVCISASGKTIRIENECLSADPALLPKWFEPFFTPDYSRGSRESGTGLGLYIVKKNLEALGFPLETAIAGGVVRFEIGLEG